MNTGTATAWSGGMVLVATATAAVLAAGATAGSASSLRVDGGTLQVFRLAGPDLPGLPALPLPEVVLPGVPVTGADLLDLIPVPVPIPPPVPIVPLPPVGLAPSVPPGAPVAPVPPAPVPAPVEYADCAAARDAGAAPLASDEPGFRPELDRDGDGVACTEADRTGGPSPAAGTATGSGAAPSREPAPSPRTAPPAGPEPSPQPAPSPEPVSDPETAPAS